MSPASELPTPNNRTARRVCLWRYASDSRNYAGTHLTADPAGCDAILAALRVHPENARGFRSRKRSQL